MIMITTITIFLYFLPCVYHIHVYDRVFHDVVKTPGLHFRGTYSIPSLGN